MRQLKISKSITNREIASLDTYLGDIAKEQLLSPDEEVQLAQRIRLGDHVALDKLVKANLRFVVSVSKQYQHQGLSLPDLINEGNIGLIKAAQRFDETRGFKFISYAVWWIRQSILQAIAEQSRLVRLPLNQLGSVNRILKEVALLEQRFERPPSALEVAESLEITEEKVKESFKISSKHVSMDAPIVEDEDISLIDVIVPDSSPHTDQTLLQESLALEIQRSLSSLSLKEKEIVNMFFGIGLKQPLTLDEIANKFNLTRERVRQIKEKALRRLKQNHRNNILKKYLG